MTDDLTQVPYYKVTVITENLADGSTETTVFDRAQVAVEQVFPEPEPIGLDRFVNVPPPPRINVSIQPLRDEETGIWIRQRQHRKG